MLTNKFKEEFLLHPDITFLNFGSFGACPRRVFEDYQRWQRELEHEPVQFMVFKGPELLRKSREALGAYVGCDADDVVYVTNPSYAVNIIAKSLDLKPGDEILSTGLEYGACDKTMNYYCRKAGAKFLRLEIPFPITGVEEFLKIFSEGITPRTKMIFVSHITSSTGLVFPVEAVCKIAKARGLMCMIDGAHAPAQVALDLSELGADIYTGACHKWMMAPKGSSFLYVKKELQKLFDPLIISWGYESPAPSQSRFIDYHQLQGTRDISAFLAVPAAIRYMNEHDWKEVARQCRSLVKKNAPRFFSLLEAEPLCPLTDDFIAQMLSIPIRTTEPEKLKRQLYEKYRIEIPVMRHGNSCFIRYSINAFNSQEDLDRLYTALQEIILENKLIR